MKLKVKQATKIFKRNSLFFKTNIKVSFVALNQKSETTQKINVRAVVGVVGAVVGLWLELVGVEVVCF